MNSMIAVLAFLPVTHIQSNPGDRFETGEYHNVDIREVLASMFKREGLNYNLSDKIQGKISLHLPPMLFDVALQAICKSSDLTYRAQPSYQMLRRELPPGTEYETPIWQPMPAYQPDPFLDAPAPSLKAIKASAAELFWKTLHQKGICFVIGTGLDMPLTLSESGKTNREVLSILTKASHASLVKSYGGAWIVFHEPSAPFPTLRS